MKKSELDADGVYIMANQMLPDDEDLAAFNAAYEIHNGKLVTDGAGATSVEEAELRGIFGIVHLDEEYGVAYSIEQDEDSLAVIELMKSRILDLPGRPEDDAEVPEIEDEYPTSIALMTAWRMPDGTMTCKVYRNKAIPQLNANMILKDALVAHEAAEAGAGESGDAFGDN